MARRAGFKAKAIPDSTVEMNKRKLVFDQKISAGLSPWQAGMLSGYSGPGSPVPLQNSGGTVLSTAQEIEQKRAVAEAAARASSHGIKLRDWLALDEEKQLKKFLALQCERDKRLRGRTDSNQRAVIAEELTELLSRAPMPTWLVISHFKGRFNEHQVQCVADDMGVFESAEGLVMPSDHPGLELEC